MLSMFGHPTLGKSFRQTQIKTKCETPVHLWAALLRSTSKPSINRFPGDTGARDAPPTGVSLHTGASSQRTRPFSPPVVLHVPELPWALSTGPMISRLSGGSQSPSTGLLPLQASPLWLLLWWRFLRSFGRWYFTHWHSSRPAPRPVVLHVPALPPTLLTGPMIYVFSPR